MPIFTRNIKNSELLEMPIAHKQGNFCADSKTIDFLEQNDLIAFKYHTGNNFNGSINDIAGIMNKKKNVLGMMPHPERASDSILGNKSGIKIFESILGSN